MTRRAGPGVSPAVSTPHTMITRRRCCPTAKCWRGDGGFGGYRGHGTLQPGKRGGPNLVSAASRLTHRAAGSFDIDMPLSGTSGVEDRDASGSFLAVFTFDAPVTSGNAQVVGGTATAGTPTFSGNEMRVPLSNVADLQVVTIEISGVNEGGRRRMCRSASSSATWTVIVWLQKPTITFSGPTSIGGYWLQLPRRHQSERGGGQARPP